MNSKTWMLSLSFCMIFFGCNNDDKAVNSTNSQEKKSLVFKSIAPAESGIDFENTVNEFDPQINLFTYDQVYMGAGVATGDLNNDGLIDIVFQSGFIGCTAYINKGNLKFEKLVFSNELLNLKAVGTGINLVDINHDGNLDIYLSYSGPKTLNPAYKRNKLLLNQGDLKFIESAQSFGLADYGNGLQSSFFDYDKDGDLDMYQVNTNSDFSHISKLYPLDDFKFDSDLIMKSNAQDRFYINNGQDQFIESTLAVGMKPDYYYGFNPSIGDFNNDGWPDVYVSNDFNTPDLLYINDGKGRFNEMSEEYFKHTSFYSMGADVGDFNNDGMDDLFVVDMFPEDYVRSRITMGMTSISEFEKMIDMGYQRQYMHNMVQLNTGNNSFSEISQLSGITKTDWSWAVLNEDFDNDGLKDLYVTNGIGREIINKDAQIRRNELIIEKKQIFTYDLMMEAIKAIPSQAIPNYLFLNKGNLKFENHSKSGKIDIPSFSHGAATADFDNDGDLDIVVNNFNQPAFLLENEGTGNNYIQFEFNGPPKNKNGIGTKLCLKLGNEEICNKLYISRGCFSGLSNRMHFGIGDKSKIDQVEITWPNGKSQTINKVKINQLNVIDYNQTQVVATAKNQSTKQLFTKPSSNTFEEHTSNEYNDFADQILLPHKLSELGPAMTSGDLNNDGVIELFLGGGKNQAAKLYSLVSNKYQEINSSDFAADAKSEDTDALFVDINGDGFKDILVSSGSYEYKETDQNLSLRLYINDGKNNFTKSSGPNSKVNSMCMSYADIDQDGDQDVFVGGRTIKGKYPFPPKSILLINENGKLKDQTAEYGKDLSNIGMVTDAEFSDIDEDGDQDLMVVGEWMAVNIFENIDGKLVKKSNELTAGSVGWWNKIEIKDINGDSKPDLILGNLGLNYKFSATDSKPLKVYCDDFDNNGTYDVVLSKFLNDKEYPVRGRTCSSEQMPFIKDKFPSFQAYAEANLNDIYGEDLNKALQFDANKFESCVMINKGDWDFEVIDLPIEAQMSPINDLVVKDFTKDGHIDLLVVGNLYGSEVETTRADAGVGLLMKGDGQGNFESIHFKESGFFSNKDARRIALLKGDQEHIVVANNSSKPDLFFVN